MGKYLPIAALVVFLFIVHPLASHTPAIANPNSFEQQVIELVNQERALRGLPPLIVHYMLMNAAEAHSIDMGTHSICQHESSDGTSFGTRIRQHGYTPNYGVAEDVACGYFTPEQVVSAWMASPAHRAHILGDYVHVGVGYYNTGDTGYRHYWTMDFGKPAPDTPPPQPTPCTLEHDFNADGRIGAEDVEMLAQHWQDGAPYDPTFDLNQDQAIDVIDVMIVSSEWGMTCP